MKGFKTKKQRGYRKGERGIRRTGKTDIHIFIYILGIHVLRILKYDRQALALRRMHCENVDTDPIVWTNQRFIRWARSIDLGEYADNLKGINCADSNFGSNI